MGSRVRLPEPVLALSLLAICYGVLGLTCLFISNFFFFLLHNKLSVKLRDLKQKVFLISVSVG